MDCTLRGARGRRQGTRALAEFTEPIRRFSEKANLPAILRRPTGHTAVFSAGVPGLFFPSSKPGWTLLVVAMAMTRSATAQDATPRPAAIVRGVTLSRGLPVAGVNVFDVETLEGSVTNESGRFTIAVGDSTRTTMHLVAKAIGYTAFDTTIILAKLSTDSLVIRLSQLSALMPISVMAGRYTATAARTSTLTPIEVANTPGSNADISGAIKTLPGVQNVDEGSGLFVRGGDFTETRMFVDGAPLFSAYQFEAPTGSVAGTINPFLTSAITFASGGFGAEWGNALSGVVDLRTQGRPAQRFTNINASILGITLSKGVAFPHGLGVSITAGATDLRAMLALNGNPRAFSPAPHGQTYSGLAAWEYRRTGVVKIFALLQKNAFGAPVQDPASLSTFASDRTSDVVVASWSDSIAKWRPFASVSTSGFNRDESKGAYDLSSNIRSFQARFLSKFVFTDRVQATTGFEVERLSADFRGTFPANQYNPVAGAPTITSGLKAAAPRTALHASIDTRPTSSTELILGIRRTNSGFAVASTVDPRLSFAWMPRGQLTFTWSWGVYHQSVDPAFLDRLTSGAPTLPEQRATMAIAGTQWGEGVQQLRVEGWTKQYHNLVGLTRSYATVAGLSGKARGADLFARTVAPLGTTARFTWSLSDSRRDDANTKWDAPAAFDVTSSMTVILQKEWKSGWGGGVAVKRATGRPFTDVASATFDANRNIYVPVYGDPFAQRLPVFNRTDITVSKQLPLGANRFASTYMGINNLLNQINTFSYTWSQNYTERLPVRSTVSRTFFVGANLVLLARP